MASRTFDNEQVLGKKRYRLDLTFFPQGAGVPTFVAKDNPGLASVARSTNGVYLLTLQDTYRRLISKQASVQMATATDLVPQFGAISNVGSATPVTVVVRVNAGATPTDVAADAANSVSVQLCFSDNADTV